MLSVNCKYTQSGEDMKQPNRIIQLNKEIRANAATIVIAAVLLYVVISVVSSLSKESVTIYQVSKGDVSNDITLQGLAIRDEVIVNTQKSGYLCYYITDGEKVKKNSTVCTIDETGEIYNTENNSDSNSTHCCQAMTMQASVP